MTFFKSSKFISSDSFWFSRFLIVFELNVIYVMLKKILSIFDSSFRVFGFFKSNGIKIH